LKKHRLGENMETIIQLIPPVSTTVQSTQIKDNPDIQFLPNSTVLYQATPTLRKIQEIQPLRRESAARSSSEGSKSVRKPRQLRVFKQRDVF
jgi:hypothetical protein